MHHIISELPPPAARAVTHTLIIHAVYFNQPSHQPRCWEQPTTIIMSGIPVHSRLEMPGARLSAVQKCPGCALPGWQDHSGLQAVSSYQPSGLGSLHYMGRVPVSSDCLFMYIWRNCACTFAHESATGPFLALLWGIFLPCGTGLVTTLNGKTWEQQQGRRGNPTKMRRNVWVDCVSACVWVFINFPNILYFSSAVSPRGKKQTQTL